MRKVELNMNQKYRYELIKQLSDTNGNRLAVALKLNCSVRTVTRWIERYRAEGKAAFIHKNKSNFNDFQRFLRLFEYANKT